MDSASSAFLQQAFLVRYQRIVQLKKQLGQLQGSINNIAANLVFLCDHLAPVVVYAQQLILLRWHQVLSLQQCLLPRMCLSSPHQYSGHSSKTLQTTVRAPKVLCVRQNYQQYQNAAGNCSLSFSFHSLQQ